MERSGHIRRTVSVWIMKYRRDGLLGQRLYAALIVRMGFWGYNVNGEMNYLEYRKLFGGRSGGYGNN